MNRGIRLIGAACALLTLAATPPCDAGGARELALVGTKALAAGTLDGAVLDSKGVVRLGPAFEATPLRAANAWAATLHEGAAWIGTGHPAGVVRVDAEGGATRHDAGTGMMVTALAPFAGGLAAAVFPNGRLVQVPAEGRELPQPTPDDEAKEAPAEPPLPAPPPATPIAQLPVEFVWSLAPDGQGGMVAATGGPAALYAISPLGAVDRICEIDDEHARCLVRDGKTWLVGTAPKGHVLRIGDDGAVEVIRDLEQQEVVGLVALPQEGGLLIAANEDQAGGNAQQLSALVNKVGSPPPTRAGQKPAKRPSLQTGHLLHFDSHGILNTIWTEKKVAIMGMSQDRDGALAGTSPEGRLIRVAPDGTWAVVGDLPEAEASVLLADGKGVAAMAVASNPAVLHRRGASAKRGTWTSDVLDANALAHWGHVAIDGEHLGGLDVRSGATDDPETGWSDWGPVKGFEGNRGTVNVRSRFLQVRVALKNAKSVLRGVRLVAQGPNHPPEIASATLTIPGTPKTGGPPPKPTPTRALAWKVKDADNDTLHVAIHARRVGTERWTEILERTKQGSTKHTWDTTGWPDGLYTVRISIDDGASNPASRARTTEFELPTHRVDNTAPQITCTLTRNSAGHLDLTGTATDASKGRIARMEASLDGGPWQVVGAADGLFDSDRESFAYSFGVADAGTHDVVVRAVDAWGNIGATAAGAPAK